MSTNGIDMEKLFNYFGKVEEEARRILEKDIPAANKFVNLEGLTNIKLDKCEVKLDVIKKECLIDFGYEAIAPEYLYPDIDETLVKKGVIGKNKIRSIIRCKEGDFDEHEILSFEFVPEKIKGYFKLYKPGYQPIKDI